MDLHHREPPLRAAGKDALSLPAQHPAAGAAADDHAADLEDDDEDPGEAQAEGAARHSSAAGNEVSFTF